MKMISFKEVDRNDSQFRLIADALPVLISYIDKDMRYRFNNKAYEKWFGLRKEDIHGKMVQEVLGEKAFRRIGAKMELALSGVASEFEGWVEYESGGTRYIRAQYIPDVGGDNKVIGFFVLVNDMTDRVRAEEVRAVMHEKLQETAAMLSRERERLGIALRTGSLGVYEWQVGDDLIWWSPETYELYGVSMESFKPSLESFTALVHPDDREELWRKTQLALEQRSEFNHAYRIIRPDGKVRWILNRSNAGLNDRGDVVRITGIAADVTDRKITEEHLENLVAERTYELKRSNQDLQQFAYVTSHDLKEPVRKIKLFAGRLQEELADANMISAKEHINKILRASDRLSAIIDGVLTYSTVGTESDEIGSVSLKPIVNEIMDDLEVLIQESGAIIECGELPEVKGSPVLLYQLFYNLLHNAIKFSRPGVRPFVEVRARRHQEPGASFHRITIRDNGIGFAPKDSQVIFDIFRRLNSKDRYEGSGLGLSLVRKIVERHGGRITAQGKEGEGALFTIDLPSTE
jgi:PAS domain S-box-containing protein